MLFRSYRGDREELEELNKSTLASYIKKASDSAVDKASEGGWKHALHLHVDDEKGKDDGEKEDHKAFMRVQGIKKAAGKLAKEEVEHLNELDSEPAYDSDEGRKMRKSPWFKGKLISPKKMKDHAKKVMDKAVKKSCKEEVQIDEAADLHVSKSEDPDYYKVTSVKHPKLKSNLAVGDTIHKNILKNNEYNGYSVKKLGEEVVDEARKTHLIASKSENGFWSDKDGWVADKESATKYHPDKVGYLPMSAKNDARLVHSKLAPDVHLDEGFIKNAFFGGMQKELKKSIKPEHHHLYNIDKVSSIGDAKNILIKARDAGHRIKEDFDLNEWMKDSGWHKRGPEVVTDKSGAKHTRMSAARDLARRALKKNKEKKAKE